MSRSPKVSAGPRISATVEKATELEIPQSEPRIPTGPGAAHDVRPPPPLPPRAPPPSDRTPSSSHQKATIHLGEGDLQPLSALGAKPAFSIGRGIVLGGRFRVKELIGAGAQCFVYSAEHTTLKSPVAIKCLQPDLVTPDLVERFAREARALTAIRNAHVAAVLDVGRAPCGTPFIVMEFLQGRDLAALLATRPRLEPRQATEILLQTCEGLAAAHALGLVHQDIKPSNIFLSDEMGIVKAKVVDFGVARVAVGKTDSGRPRFSQSELDDTVGGTPFYMPPEQFYADTPVDPRSDIFSLGMVLYEMLRGTHAFDLEMSTRKPGQRVRIEHTGIDPALIAVVERCLEQRPEARFESVAELAVALLPFAPSRARAHADAAAALLRKAGLSDKSRMPSSIPPPVSKMAPLVLPRPPALPDTVPPRARRRAARWPIYVGVAIAVSGGALALIARSLSTSSAPTTQAVADEAKGTAGATSAIAIHPVVRTTPPPPSASEPIEVELPAASEVRPVANGPGLARASTGDNARAGARDAASPAASAPATKPAAAPNGTSEDLGF